MRLFCVLLVVVFVISSIPILSPAAKTQILPLRTVWENPYTLTTYHLNDEVNSTFYTFPKVIWNGSQYVDYIFNSSDMSAGIGSVYIKVLPDHTVFYDPYKTEETIRSETWIVEEYNGSSSTWQVDSPVGDDVHYLVNSSGIYFDRTTMLCSGTTLDEWYWLRIGSQLKISVILHPAQSSECRLVWTLDGVSGVEVRYLSTTRKVTTQFVEDQGCSNIQFLSDNESKCLADWSDAVFFDKASDKWETCFRQVELQKDASDDRSQARILFANFLLAQGESVILDPTINTFNSTAASDGYIEKFGDSYPPTNWTLVSTSSDILMVGQNYAPTYYGSPYYYYYQYRSYVSFDTSTIPALAYNISATLELKTCYDNSLQDFTLQVTGGNQIACIGNLTILEYMDGPQPIYNNNLTSDSWGTGTAHVASWNTNGYPGDNYYINLTVPATQINKVNSTEFELKTDREGTPPSQMEFVSFWSGGSAGNEPILQVSYCLDTVTVNGETWFYRNASTSSVTIVFFGGWLWTNTSVWIRSIDLTIDKELGKIMFLDALVANGFSIYTPANSAGYSYESYYQNDSTWIRDLTVWLIDTQNYSHVYLFGLSGGGTVVGNEIQKDYASRFSAAVMNCAPVDWQNNYNTSLTGQMWHTALTAFKAKVATSFPENVEDQFYTQEKKYYDNAIVDKERHNWTGVHGDFFHANHTCIWHTCNCPSGENDSVAVINWFNAAHPPTAPFTPTGSQTGYTSYSYSYSSGTVDPDGENVSYVFNWGDGTNSTTGSHYSGTNVTCNHAWNSPGSYNVTVCGEDTSQTWSCWSPPLTVDISDSGGESCPFVSTWNGTGYVLDNNILPQSETSNGTDVTDYYTLEQPLVPTNGQYALLLTEFEHEHSCIDYAQLLAVDHPASVNVGVSPSGQVLTYTHPYPAASGVTNDGKNVTNLLQSVDGNYYQGYNGSYVTLNFGRLDVSRGAKLVIVSDMIIIKCPIYIQTRDAHGVWRTVATIYTRNHWSTDVIDLKQYLPDKGGLMVRLCFVHNDTVDFVGLDTSPQTRIDIHPGQLVSAISSADGDVTAKLLYADKTYAELVPGENIQLAFNLHKQTMQVRTYIIISKGHYYTITP